LAHIGKLVKPDQQVFVGAVVNRGHLMAGVGQKALTTDGTEYTDKNPGAVAFVRAVRAFRG
jgi:endonuclease V-like protein UPF0215 family